MEQQRNVDRNEAIEPAEEQLRQTREYLESVSAERDATVPPAQDQAAQDDADTLGDALPGAPNDADTLGDALAGAPD